MSSRVVLCVYLLHRALCLSRVRWSPRRLSRLTTGPTVRFSIPRRYSTITDSTSNILRILHSTTAYIGFLLLVNLASRVSEPQRSLKQIGTVRTFFFSCAWRSASRVACLAIRCRGNTALFGVNGALKGEGAIGVRDCPRGVIDCGLCGSGTLPDPCSRP